MATHTVKVDLAIKPQAKMVLAKVIENLETMNSLLRENKELLTKALQGSFEVVNGALESPDVITSKTQ